jgi:hypothetical protein
VQVKIQVKITETMVMNEILYKLNKMGVGSFDRINNVPAYNEKLGQYKRLSFYARKGASDIIGIRNGRFIAIEVKTEKTFGPAEKYKNEIWSDPFSKKPIFKSKIHLWEQICYLKEKELHGAIAFFSYGYAHAIDRILKSMDNKLCGEDHDKV